MFHNFNKPFQKSVIKGTDEIVSFETMDCHIAVYLWARATPNCELKSLTFMPYSLALIVYVFCVF